MAGINYVELHSADSAGSQSFYSKLFDWKFERVPKAEPEYHMHNTGNGGVGLLAAEHAPMWLPYVTVNSVAASAKQAVSLGGKVIKERTEIPAGIFAIVADPTGLQVAFWEKRDSRVMRRAERLFQLVQILRNRRLVTAQFIAESLEVSERTVYRDVRDLTLSGVPIRGEAGVGYALGQGFDLPPLMFTPDELEALVLGVRVVQGYADPGLARAADSVLAKVQLVLPQALRDGVGSSKLLVPNLSPGRYAPHLGTLREAIRDRRRVKLQYADGSRQATNRTVRPLALAFWGKVWSLAAWCELRKDFRSFRLDRMASAGLATVFEHEQGKTLDDFIDAMTRRTAEKRA